MTYIQPCQCSMFRCRCGCHYDLSHYSAVPGALCFNHFALKIKSSSDSTSKIQDASAIRINHVPMCFFFPCFIDIFKQGPSYALYRFCIPNKKPFKKSTSQIIESKQLGIFFRVLYTSSPKKWDPTIPLRFVVPVGSWRQLGSLPTCSHVTGRFIKSVYGKQMSLCEERDWDRCVAFDLRVNFKLIGWWLVFCLSVCQLVVHDIRRETSCWSDPRFGGYAKKKAWVIKPSLNHQSVVALIQTIGWSGTAWSSILI